MRGNLKQQNWYDYRCVIAVQGAIDQIFCLQTLVEPRALCPELE
jgi:hypothetical protein